MKEEILTAKEWLEQETEGYCELYHDCHYENINYNQFLAEFERYLERYADYKTKMLEGKILQFRQMLEKQAINHATKLYKDWFKTDQVENNIVLESYISCVKEDMLLKEFDKHFGIEIKTENKIN